MPNVGISGFGSERPRAGVKASFGDDWPQYEMIGGTH